MALEKLGKIPSLVRKVGQSASKAQPFYSPVDEAIARITQGKGTGAQMLAELLKTKGVAKELKDRPAIKKALEAAKDTKVTKADVERLAAENPVASVQETTIGAPYKTGEMDRLLDQWAAQNSGPTADAINRGETLFATRQLAEEAGDTDVVNLIDRVDSEAKFQKYTIPGGENYREVLIKLPENRKKETWEWFDPDTQESKRGFATQQEAYDSRPNISSVVSRVEAADSPQNYRSSHFDDPNILAHARVIDRVGPNGEKILHVEEIQSDWHQAGRREGYNRGEEAKNAEREFKSYAEDLASKYGLNPEQNLAMYATMKRMQPDEVAKYEELQSAWVNSKGGVPDAPFKQNWHELVMKRLLDDAARNGYDKVVITPGAKQAERYDLSKQISRVVYSPTTETLNAFDNSGKSVLMKSGITPERVEDYIGKEPAKRLLDPQNTKSYLRGGKEDSYHEITGEDLRVGGEGMKGFYDQILPSYLNDYGKRYGARVGTYNLPDPEVHHIPTIADIERGGMEMFGRADLTPEETLQVENAFKAQRSAETAIPLHSFDITPQMREEITTKGQPLYQVAPPVAIGAGAAMQEEEPTEYAGGGAVKKALKAVLPKGQKAVLPAAESAANLERFLADSAVKNRLYHGTMSPDINQFRTPAYFSGKNVANQFANPEYLYGTSKLEKGEHPNVLPVHVNIKKPKVYTTDEEYEDYVMGLSSVPDDLVKQGYDGIIYAPGGKIDDPAAYFVPFEPTQIKSAIGNRGTYDINEADINKAKGGQVSKDAMWMAVQNKQIKKRAEGGPVHMAKGGDLIRAGKSLMRMKNRMTAEPFAKPSVVKEPGGNWLAGTVEDEIIGLKRNVLSPEELEGLRARQGEQVFADMQRNQAPDIAVNNWLDTKLNRYIKNEMATPKDPLRALAERGVLHYQPSWVRGDRLEDLRYARESSGMLDPHMADEGLARRWENISDLAINTTPARTFTPQTVAYKENPWLSKVSPETQVHTPNGLDELGFSHIVDELRNALDSTSGLPRNLQLTPEQLNKVTVPQAVERVAQINAWREAQKVKADAARAMNPATVVHREYPTIPGTEMPNERGLRWVEMRAPEELPAGWREETREGRQWFFDPEGKAHNVDSDPRYASLQDALKYEGETMGHCVGGYCPDVVSGKTRIYSLRDAKGQPHVTIEVQPNKTLPRWDDVRPYLSVAEEEAKKLPNGYTDQDISNIATEMAKKAMPSSIVQIKGKANRKPNEEYLPFVQDFVRSGQWGDVGDIQNTGMRSKSSVFSDQELARLQEAGEADIPHILTGEEIQRLHNMIVPEGKRLKYDAAGNIIGDEAGYAKGGAVSCDCDHDAMQFAVWDKQLRKKHGN